MQSKNTKILFGVLTLFVFVIFSNVVFADEQTENEIFRGLKPTTLQNVKGISAVYQVDKSDIFI